jgi:stalled ribosome rescue protein Dom34
MNQIKKIGIFMDHSNAHFMEYSDFPKPHFNIVSKFTHLVKEQSLSGKGENLMHQKEQHQQHEYYNKISDIIRNYESVLLFGPTEAKIELYNLLQTNHLFNNIEITVENTDKMTDNQQHAFVNEFFKNHLLN